MGSDQSTQNSAHSFPLFKDSSNFVKNLHKDYKFLKETQDPYLGISI